MWRKRDDCQKSANTSAPNNKDKACKAARVWKSLKESERTDGGSPFLSWVFLHTRVHLDIPWMKFRWNSGWNVYSSRFPNSNSHAKCNQCQVTEQPAGSTAMAESSVSVIQNRACGSTVHSSSHPFLTFIVHSILFSPIPSIRVTSQVMWVILLPSTHRPIDPSAPAWLIHPLGVSFACDATWRRRRHRRRLASSCFVSWPGNTGDPKEPFNPWVLCFCVSSVSVLCQFCVFCVSSDADPLWYLSPAPLLGSHPSSLAPARPATKTDRKSRYQAAICSISRSCSLSSYSICSPFAIWIGPFVSICIPLVFHVFTMY